MFLFKIYKQENILEYVTIFKYIHWSFQNCKSKIFLRKVINKDISNTFSFLK